VVEAGIKSGALITSKFAMEQGREVFAVPGSINSPVSKGPNKLIQQGAKLVTCVEDVLEELNISMVVEKTAVQLALPSSREEAALLPLLSHESVHVDELSRQSGMAANTVSGTLTLMELKGMVKQTGGMNYALA
jgi:DNA processing protein